MQAALGRGKAAYSKFTLSLRELRRLEDLTNNKVSFAECIEFFLFENVEGNDWVYWVVRGLDTLLFAHKGALYSGMQLFRAQFYGSAYRQILHFISIHLLCKCQISASCISKECLVMQSSHAHMQNFLLTCELRLT